MGKLPALALVGVLGALLTGCGDTPGDGAASSPPSASQAAATTAARPAL